MSVQKEIPVIGLEPVDRRNQDIRADQALVLSSLEVETPASLSRERNTSYNKRNLTAGIHPPVHVKRPFSMVGGIGVKTVTNRQSILDEKAVVDGIHFKNSSGSTGELVIVGTGATNPLVRVVFRNCVFERTERMLAPFWIRVAPGARAVFVGCMFSGGHGAGLIVDNQAPNVATDVHLIGCVNATGVLAGPVTSTGVIS